MTICRLQAYGYLYSIFFVSSIMWVCIVIYLYVTVLCITRYSSIDVYWNKVIILSFINAFAKNPLF